jgi:hypothetical protein
MNILNYIGQDTRVVELIKGLRALYLSFQQIDVLCTVITFSPSGGPEPVDIDWLTYTNGARRTLGESQTLKTRHNAERLIGYRVNTISQSPWRASPLSVL